MHAHCLARPTLAHGHIPMLCFFTFFASTGLTSRSIFCISSVVAHSFDTNSPTIKRDLAQSKPCQLGNEVGPMLLVKLIDKARTIQLLEKLGIGKIFGICGFADGIFSLSSSSTILNPS